MSKLIAYSIGIVAASVCVDDTLTTEEIESIMNAENPTGISSKWQISKDKYFHSGETNPCVCENDTNRKHYLMVC